jgi:hypothetical protein
MHYSASAGPTTANGNRGGGGVFVGNAWPCGYGVSGTNLTGLCNPVGSQIWSVNNGGTSSGTVVIQQTIGLAIGQTSNFVEELWFQNIAPGTTGGFVPQAGTNTIDASNTAWLNITSLNSNATFTTGSGSTYSGSPEAPEPDTLALLAAGLIGLAVAKRTASRLPI